MKCIPIDQPDSGMDAIVFFKRKTISSSIKTDSVQLLSQPYLYNFSKPILPLSSYILIDPPTEIKNMQYPILINLFNPTFQSIEFSHFSQCPNCHSLSLSSPSSQCPFCSLINSTKISTSFYKIPNNSPKSTQNNANLILDDDLFIMVVIGDQPSVFYESLSKFNYKFILLSFDQAKKQFTAIIPHKSKENLYYKFVTLLDSDIPLSSNFILFKPESLPHFPASNNYKSDLNEVLSLIPSLDCLPFSYHHFFFFVSIPHTDLISFSIPNSTFSLFSCNSLDCNCSSICKESGGLFMPFCHSPCFGCSDSFKDLSFVRNITFQSPIIHSVSHKSYLLHPYRFLIDKTINLNLDFSKNFTQNTFLNFQIVIQTNDYFYIISDSIDRQKGFKEFLSQSSLPNLLISSEIPSIIAKYSGSGESIAFPNSLRHSPFFTSYYNPTLYENANVIDNFLWDRPFVWQFYPTEKVIDFVSSEIATSLSLLVILFKGCIYIWMGSDLKMDVWDKFIGRRPEPNHLSFELADQNFNSSLWALLRELRQYYPFPIVIVPSESGRRVQLIDIMNADKEKGSNHILNLLAYIANIIPEH